MGYRRATTECRVQLIALPHLPADTAAQCESLRREAGRCWTDLAAWHAESRRQGRWLSDTELKAQTVGGRYQLHSQSVQALIEQLMANLAATTRLRQDQRTAGQPVTSEYPHHPKPYQTLVWKQSATTIAMESIQLSNGWHVPPLVLPLPPR